MAAMRRGWLDWQVDMCDPDIFAEYEAFWEAEARVMKEDAEKHKREMANARGRK